MGRALGGRAGEAILGLGALDAFRKEPHSSLLLSVPVKNTKNVDFNFTAAP